MLLLNPDLINSCRVCRSPNQDGDYECLYESSSRHEERPVLSEAGMLYEHLLDISLNMWDYYPQFLCNSCDLQMKLFKKLKDKAYKTFEYLQNLYEGDMINSEQNAEQACKNNQEALEAYEFGVNENLYLNEPAGLTENADYQENTDNNLVDLKMEQQKVLYREENYANTVEIDADTPTQESTTSLNNLRNQIKKEVEPIASKLKYHYSTEKLPKDGVNSEENIPQIRLDLEHVIDNNNYVSDIKVNSEENIQQISLDFEPIIDKNEYLKINSEENISQNSLDFVPVTDTNEFLKINSEENVPQISLDFEPVMDKTDYVTEMNVNSDDNIPQISLDFGPVIDKNDYVTEIYELLDDENTNETYSQDSENLEVYDIYMDEKTESSSVFSDVEFLIDGEMYSTLNTQNSQNEFQISSPAKKIKVYNTGKRKNNGDANKKREYKCVPCQLEFNSPMEHKAHRAEVHDNKYPCSVCANELKSLASLHQHMKKHSKTPAFQCEICQKTFNQKAHLKYHMNNHNNVRNFKCSECEKSFISKADLKVHMRCHTGQRPYVCNLCGKDYLMMEHLKTHLLTHTGEVFLCNICNHTFSTHKTLRLHVRTIHEDEPRFKCTFCSKPFRRKHHLEYHLGLHQKNVKFLDTQYEMIDDPDSVLNTEAKDINTNDLVDQEIIDDPGFIALND